MGEKGTLKSDSTMTLHASIGGVPWLTSCCKRRRSGHAAWTPEILIDFQHMGSIALESAKLSVRSSLHTSQIVNLSGIHVGQAPKSDHCSRHPLELQGLCPSRGGGSGSWCSLLPSSACEQQGLLCALMQQS